MLLFPGRREIRSPDCQQRQSRQKILLECDFGYPLSRRGRNQTVLLLALGRREGRRSFLLLAGASRRECRADGHLDGVAE